MVAVMSGIAPFSMPASEELIHCSASEKQENGIAIQVAATNARRGSSRRGIERRGGREHRERRRAERDAEHGHDRRGEVVETDRDQEERAAPDERRHREQRPFGRTEIVVLQRAFGRREHAGHACNIRERCSPRRRPRAVVSLRAIDFEPDADLADLEVSDADHSGAELSRGELARCRFTGVRFAGARFDQARLVDVEFVRCDLAGADFSEASLAPGPVCRLPVHGE